MKPLWEASRGLLAVVGLLVASGLIVMGLGGLAIAGSLSLLGLALLSCRWRIHVNSDLDGRQGVPRWAALAWIVFAGLLTWSWGFSNIALPLGVAAVPACEVIFGALAFHTRSRWLPVLRAEVPGWGVAAIVMGFLVIARLVVDFPRFGSLAVRDALFMADLAAFPVGIAVGLIVGAARTERAVEVSLKIAVAWFLLFPARDAIANFGPMVGVLKPVPLFTFLTAGTGAAIALLWFLPSRGSAAFLWSSLSLVVLAMVQNRGQYVGIPLALAVGFMVRRSGSSSGRAARLSGAALVLIVVIAVAPPLPGRMGQVSLDTVIEQVGTLRGDEGLGSGSADLRKDWVSTVLNEVNVDPVKQAFGVGLGPDLLNGYRGPGGELIRKPHNDFLEMFARMGLAGLLAWLALLAIPIRAMVRGAQTGSRMCRWGVEAHVVLLVSALTQPLFAFAYGGIVYWFIAGLAIAGLSSKLPHPGIGSREASGVSGSAREGRATSRAAQAWCDPGDQSPRVA